MKQVCTMLLGGLAITVVSVGPLETTAEGAEPPSESQLQRLLDTAARATDSPDHDYVANSLHSMLEQSQDLQLTHEQIEKIRTIQDQYERTRRDREQAYRQSELEALTRIHDNRSSMASVEQAVQKADQDHSKLRIAGIKALREARDVLRPEQYGSWRQSHAARQAAERRPHREASRLDAEQDHSGRIAPHEGTR